MKTLLTLCVAFASLATFNATSAKADTVVVTKHRTVHHRYHHRPYHHHHAEHVTVVHER